MSRTSNELAQQSASCQDTVLLQTYLKPQGQCVDVHSFKNPEEANARELQAWIPCNDVERIDSSRDFFGPMPQDNWDSLLSSLYARIYFDWLGQQDRFVSAEEALHNASPNNPILETAFARKIKELIQGAERSLIINASLLGGTWGSSIAKELGLAAGRGVEVILVYDGAKHPSEELSLLREAIEQNPDGFLILTSHRDRPSAASVDVLTSTLGFGDHEASSIDRSGLLLVDTLFDKALHEYLRLRPKALLGSRHLLDSAGFHHDESIVVQGPAAVAATISYAADIRRASLNPSQQMNHERLQGLRQRLEKLAKGPTLVKGQGWVSVQALESSQALRNLDLSILSRLSAAQDSIDIYGRFALNRPLAQVLHEAIARGVRVRILLDQQAPETALANASLPFMIMEAAQAKGNPLQEAELPVRWFLPLRPAQRFASSKRADLVQELHAKTIIVDGRWSLYGSANFDSVTWSGAFREYAVWVDDPALATQASQVFERIWQHPFLSVSHGHWIAAKELNPTLIKHYQHLAKSQHCDADDCGALDILQGGRDYASRPGFKELLQKAGAGPLSPQEILRNEQGLPRCINQLDSTRLQAQ